MREWCACGSAVRGSYRRVAEWRSTHRCTLGQPELEPPKQGAFSHIEQSDEPRGLSDAMRFAPTVNARIGFTPNE